MKYKLILLLAILPISNGCIKNGSRYSGSATIDNTLYGNGPYYALGFSFDLAQKISTLNVPAPDVTIDNDGTLYNLILQSNNYENSFAKEGEYDDEASAKNAFNELISPENPVWVVWADSLKPNQIWLYRSGTARYAKMRIISTVSEVRDNRNYSECTFEWVYQPDGTLSFPAK